jgi:proteasome lid subunit RPN8/RPN11
MSGDGSRSDSGLSGDRPGSIPPGRDTPWIRGDLRIGRDAIADIEDHARECYPKECCGFVFGPADDPSALVGVEREVNEADKYHALDPERFPRTAETYFKINELRAARAFERRAADGHPIKVIYHSHCDAGAYFSEEDATTFARDETLMWPCAFIVVSVRAGEVVDRKLWVHVPGTNDFVASSLTVT